MLRNSVFDFMCTVPQGKIGVAVSGGSDSVSLLLLLAEWAEANNRQLCAVTVDHGLRAASAGEAVFVGQLCVKLGVDHEILTWEGSKDQGNLQASARNARYGLMNDWALENRISAIAIGHTRDDQAETFLQRLKRGSGVDGLAAMRPVVQKDGIVWIRPLLDQRRSVLQEYLRDQNIEWVDDPSNDDLRFDRVKLRKFLPYLEEIGLGVDRLSDTAAAMARAREALETMTLTIARRCAQPRNIGSVRLDIEFLMKQPEEIQLRVFAHCLGWVSGNVYRPRLKALQTAKAAVIKGQAFTLMGCMIASLKSGGIEVVREPAACTPTDAARGVFDGRWRCDLSRGEWRPLGEEGLKFCPDWRETAESKNAITASPSLWYNNELQSAPFGGKKGLCTCSLIGGTENFFASIMTH